MNIISKKILFLIFISAGQFLHLSCADKKVVFSSDDKLLLKEVFANIAKNKVVQSLEGLKHPNDWVTLRSDNAPVSSEGDRVGLSVYDTGFGFGLSGKYITNNPAIKEKCERAEQEQANAPWWKFWTPAFPEFETGFFKCRYYPISDYPKGNKRTRVELYCSTIQAKKCALIEALKNLS